MAEPGTVDTEFSELDGAGATTRESHSLYDKKWTPNREETNNDRVLRDLEIKKLKQDASDRVWRRVLQIAELVMLFFIYLGVRAMLDLKAKSDSRDAEWTRRTLQLDSFSIRQEKALGNQLRGLSSLGRIEGKQDSILEGKRRSKVPTFTVDTKATVTPGKKVEFALPAKDSLQKNPKN